MPHLCMQPEVSSIRSRCQTMTGTRPRPRTMHTIQPVALPVVRPRAVTHSGAPSLGTVTSPRDTIETPRPGQPAERSPQHCRTTRQDKLSCAIRRCVGGEQVGNSSRSIQCRSFGCSPLAAVSSCLNSSWTVCTFSLARLTLTGLGCSAPDRAGVVLAEQAEPRRSCHEVYTHQQHSCSSTHAGEAGSHAAAT